MYRRYLLRSLFILLFLLPYCVFAQDEPFPSPEDYAVLSAENVHLLEIAGSYGEGSFTGEPVLSPDKSHVVVPGSSGLWIFAFGNFAEPERLLPGVFIRDVEWVGTELFVVTDERTYLYNTMDDQFVEEWEGAKRIAVSGDGRYMVLVLEQNWGNTGLDVQPVFRVFDRDTDELKGTVYGMGMSTGSALFTEGGNYLITVSSCYLPQYCEIRTLANVWDMSADLPQSTAAPYFLDDLYPYLVLSQAVALDGARIAYLSDDPQMLTIADLSTGEERQQITTFSGDIGTLKYVDEQLIIVESWDTDRVVRIVDVNTGEIVQSVDITDSNVGIVPFMPEPYVTRGNHNNVQYITAEGDELIVVESFEPQNPDITEFPVDAEQFTGRLTQCMSLELDNGGTACGLYNSDGSLFVGQESYRYVNLWNVVTMEQTPIMTVEPNDFFHIYGFNDQGEVVFSVSDCMMGSRCSSTTVYIFNTDTLEMIAEITVPELRQLILPNDQWDVMFIASETEIDIVDIASSEIVRTIEGAAIQGVLIVDRRFLVVQHYYGVVQVWGVPVIDE